MSSKILYKNISKYDLHIKGLNIKIPSGKTVDILEANPSVSPSLFLQSVSRGELKEYLARGFLIELKSVPQGKKKNKDLEIPKVTSRICHPRYRNVINANKNGNHNEELHNILDEEYRIIEGMSEEEQAARTERFLERESLDGFDDIES